MADALDIHLFQQSQNALDVNLGGSQQRLGNGSAGKLLPGDVQFGIVVIDVEDLPAKAEAVGVDAGGSQRDDHISGTHFGVVDDLLFIHNAHSEASQIVIFCRHQTGMLGGLAANQGSTGLDTALCHTGNNLGNLLRIILAAGNVIKEKQGLCTDTDNVVDTHGDGVDADGIVLIHKNGKLDLGAAAVCTGNQNRLFHTGNGQAEAAAKAAHIVQTTLVSGAGNVLLHQLNGPVAGGDIHTGSRVAGRLGILVIHDLAPCYFYNLYYSFPFQQ